VTTHQPTLPALSRRHAMSHRPSRRRRVAGVAAAGFLVIASFQVALAVGAPFGRAAFGGANVGTLPLDLRLVSAVAAALWALAALHALSRGGFLRRFPLLGKGRVTWVLAGVTALGALMNAASSSPWERFGWAPLTLSISILCVILGRRASREGIRDEDRGSQ
jgi:hypothetical protein